MQIEKHYKPEACASDDASRFVLQSVRLDASDPEKPVAVSTNGGILICLPVVLAEGETSRTIPASVFPKARKASGRAFSYCEIGVNGAFTLADGSILPTDKELDESNFPNWRQVVPPADREGSIKISIDPTFLKAIADGMGVGKGDSITLEIVPDRPSSGEGATYKPRINGEPIRVTASKAHGAFGVLMPMRTA